MCGVIGVVQLYIAKGIGSPRGFVKGVLDANALFSEAGLDSGRVNVESTAGLRTGGRHWDLLYLKAGLQEDPPLWNRSTTSVWVLPTRWSQAGDG